MTTNHAAPEGENAAVTAFVARFNRRPTTQEFQLYAAGFYDFQGKQQAEGSAQPVGAGLTDYPSLYDRTGDIKDINTLLVPRASLSAAAPAPGGWRLVPVEPTDEMETAAENDYEERGETFPDWKSKYRAMLSAAPVPVDGKEGQS